MLEFFGVSVFIAALFGVWFLLQILTSRFCRQDPQADPLQPLAQGCGTCEREGLCSRAKRCRN